MLHCISIFFFIMIFFYICLHILTTISRDKSVWTMNFICILNADKQLKTQNFSSFVWNIGVFFYLYLSLQFVAVVILTIFHVRAERALAFCVKIMKKKHHYWMNSFLCAYNIWIFSFVCFRCQLHLFCKCFFFVVVNDGKSRSFNCEAFYQFNWIIESVASFNAYSFVKAI